MSPVFAARHCYRLSPVSLLLYPFGLVYGLVVRLRRLLYRLNVVSSVRLPVPVIVVGNLTVGGTGKTPLVLWLAAELQREGRRPAIMWRGYGGAGVGARGVPGCGGPGPRPWGRRPRRRWRRAAVARNARRLPGVDRARSRSRRCQDARRTSGSRRHHLRRRAAALSYSAGPRDCGRGRARARQRPAVARGSPA